MSVDGSQSHQPVKERSRNVDPTPTSTRVKRSSSLHKMLNTLISERRKDNRIDNDCLIVNNNSNPDAFWTAVFSRYFLTENHIDGSRDDLLFFVRNVGVQTGLRQVSSSSSLQNYQSQQDEKVEVFRKDSKNLPSLGDPLFNWEETVYLNLILQQFEYKLTCAVCSRTGDSELQILKKMTETVYASPSHRQMDGKGTGETITYPDIFFSVDNFDEVFSDLVIRDSESVCVELVASDKNGDFQAVIFIGSIRYEALRTVFDNKQSSLSSKMRQSLTFGTQNRISNKRTEFIRMRGPQGKGHAEMAISRMKGVPDTPMTTPLSTPLHTPAATPAVTPEREELPPFPTTSDDQNQNNHKVQTSTSVPLRNQERRYSEVSNHSPFRSTFKWGFGIKKSQSATDSVSTGGTLNENGEIEAKSISEELHQTGSGLFGKSFAFGQAWHWFKEQRRAASVGLTASLTYVTLPWHRIIGDILDTQRTPVLSF